MPRATGSILVALVAALILPTAVSAGRPDRSTETSTQVWCGDLRSEAGSAYVSAWLSDSGDTFADLGFWAAPAEPGEDPVTWAGWSNDGLMTLDGSILSISFGVYIPAADEESEPAFVGEATFSATLTPSGETETFRSHDQFGNRHVSSRGSAQRYDVTGTLVLPTGIEFDLGDCEIVRSSHEWFGTNPRHSVSHASELSLSCGWETEQGYVALFGWNADDATGSSVWVSSGDTFLVGFGQATLSSSGFDASFDLYPGWDEVESVGTASASADLTNLGRISDTQSFGGSRFTFKGVRLGIAGSLAIETPGGTTSLVMDDSSCQASDIRISELPARHVRAEPVSNDTVDTAIKLNVGDKVLAATASAETAPEAPCVMDDGEGGSFEAPMTNTVWWRIEGTGALITVDTAGSTFDTIVAVYLAEGDEVGEQVGCVDDVEEGLEARITFDTVADASYLVQTGGFDGSTGDLTVLVSE